MPHLVVYRDQPGVLRLQVLNSQSQFLDQPNSSATPLLDPAPRRFALCGAARLAGGFREVLLIPIQDRPQSGQIVRQSPHNLMPLKSITHRHLHGPVERKISAMDAIQQGCRCAKYEIALQQAAAKPPPSQLDLTGE
jgi:hypothetical protein